MRNLQGYTSSYEAGDFGFDAMGLGLAGSGGIRFESQTIAAIATKDYYLGHLGLNRDRVVGICCSTPHMGVVATPHASKWCQVGPIN